MTPFALFKILGTLAPLLDDATLASSLADEVKHLFKSIENIENKLNLVLACNQKYLEGEGNV